ncbi:MAG TPA: DMT family transporter [Ignavibacteria bacterium]|nr:DMT family transporter [Ignavibacteria bacterium]HMQ98682.1 DMT family transporter [Ignavibacteria bacterium]
MNIPAHRKGLLYISFTAFLWSTSGFFIKYLTINAYQISFFRSLIAALTVFFITMARKKKLKFEFDKVSNFAAIFYAGILILFVLATKMTTAANAIFLQFTAPMYLVVLEPLFLKTKFNSRNVVTIIICIFGMMLFFFGKLELGNIYGNLLAIASGMCFAMFSLLLKYKKVKHKNDNTLNNVIMGNVLVAVIAFFVVFPDFKLDLTQSLILLYMGAIQIGVSYIIFNEGIKYVSATESMIIATLEAIFNPIWVFVGIGEMPSIYSIFGGLIIFAAIIWRNFSKKEKSLIIE